MANELKTITWLQLQKHTLPSDCWFVIDGIVYSATDFLVQHPGGDEILIKWSGLNATNEFDKVGHSEYAKSLRNARIVGKIQSESYPEGYEERLIGKKIEQSAKKKRKVILEPIDPEIISRHNSEEDCWIIINDNVYDVTSYLNSHPGGVAKIMQYAGKDATKAFQQENHSPEAIEKKQQYYIGKVQKSSPMNMLLILLVLLLAGLYAGYKFL